MTDYLLKLQTDYISGERLQALCDFEWRPGLNLPKSPCAVYVCGDDWSKAWLEFGNNLDTKYILLTHNSDQNFTAGHEAELPPNVVKWFGQNMDVCTDRTQGVPIGIANSKWPHGNMREIVLAIQQHEVETNKWFGCFKVETNINERLQLHYLMKSNPAAFNGNNYPMSRPDFLKGIRNSFLSLSPPGNGIDCHRTWEILYCQRHAVVKNSLAISYFNDCNLVTYDSLEKITPPKYLTNKSNESMWLSTWAEQLQKAKELL